MSDVAAPTGMLRPPSERPAGKRGVRGTIAALVAIGGLLPLPFLTSDARTAWGEPAIVAAVLVLFGGSVLLWTARRPVWIAIAALAVAAGGAGAWVAVAAENRAEARAHPDEIWAGASVAFTGARGPLVTKAEAKAVPKRLTRAQLVERLGRPAARGVQHVTTGEPDLHCLAYRRSDRRPIDRGPLNAFCFRNGRYVALREW